MKRIAPLLPVIGLVIVGLLCMATFSDGNFIIQPPNALILGVGNATTDVQLKNLGGELSVNQLIHTTGTPMTQILTANSSGITATTPGSVVFTWGALPVSANFGFDCDLMYQQATAAGGVGFAVQGATNAPTRLDAWADIYSNATGTLVGSAVANLTTTTATAFSTATPSATATTYEAKIHGLVQNSSSATTLNILAFTGNASDAVTVMAGSKCMLTP